MNSTNSTEQALEHQPSPEIRRILGLAQEAQQEVNQLGADIFRRFDCGNVPAKGDHLRNAAICLWRSATATADKLSDLAQQASAAEASAQSSFKAAAHHKRNMGSDLREKRLFAERAYPYVLEVAHGYQEASRRFCAEAVALYDTEAAILFDSIGYFLMQAKEIRP